MTRPGWWIAATVFAYGAALSLATFSTRARWWWSEHRYVAPRHSDAGGAFMLFFDWLVVLAAATILTRRLVRHLEERRGWRPRSDKRTSGWPLAAGAVWLLVMYASNCG